MKFWGWLRDEHNRGALGVIGGVIAALAAGSWAIYQHVHPNGEPEIKMEQVRQKDLNKLFEKKIMCSFVSIKLLGWNGGHKTNYCKSKGYEHGNFNQGDYKNGGICLTGTDPNICKQNFIGAMNNRYECTVKNNITNCYQIKP